MPKFKQTKFYLEDSDCYPGYTDGQTWNGWACPYFTKEVATQIMLDFKEKTDGSGKYLEDEDAFTFAASSGFDGEHYEGTDIVVDNETIHVYPLGAWCWVWDEAIYNEWH